MRTYFAAEHGHRRRRSSTITSPRPIAAPARDVGPPVPHGRPSGGAAEPSRDRIPRLSVSGGAAGPLHAFGRISVHSPTSGSADPSREVSKDPLHGTSSAPGSACRSAALDVLAVGEEVPRGPYLDQAAAPAAAPVAPAAPAAAGPARPTELLQLLTTWAPGANRYGFQLSFRCRSTSGNVADLQGQAPNLIWRERVTYSRNDFAHRISPPNPTILPPGGVSFAAANTRRVGTNLLEFNGATDTHWMPTSAIRAGDFSAAPPPPGFIGPVQPPLPAVMESRQLYQYSPDAGATWRYFAGAFIIRRTLFRDGTGLRFRTQKTGVHTVTEPYKP